MRQAATLTLDDPRWSLTLPLTLTLTLPLTLTLTLTLSLPLPLTRAPGAPSCDPPCLPVASGSLGPAQTERVHALSPLAEWQLALAVDGY